MNSKIAFLGGFAALLLSAAGQAATITVTTTADEANCLCSTNGCSTKLGCDIHLDPQSYPLSTGCSLREALQDIADVAGGQVITYQECGTPDTGGNTIVLGANAIDIYSAVPDPTDSTGAAMVNNGQLPFILKASGMGGAGKYTITGGALSCEYDPNAQPAVGGNSMFTTTDGALLEFQGTSFSSCTSPSDGVVVQNQGNSTGDLILTGTTFTGIRAVNQGNGGCIAHGAGNLVVTGSAFTGCVVDDGGEIPGSGAGNGGAIYMSAAGGTTRVLISGTAFTANIAGNNGGALYLSGTDAVAIDTSTFEANLANGNTFDSGNGVLGGGAIFAQNTAKGGIDQNQQGLYPSAFLIFQTNFLSNAAPFGTGGAILLNGGNLTTGTLGVNIAGYQNGDVSSIPGGIVASNFSLNIASGTWDTQNNGNVDPRAGSGGALFADGNVSILASSFVETNTSTSASGGAIAFYDAGASSDPIEIANTTISGNSAGLNGGGVALIPSKFTQNVGRMDMINATVADNSASGAGGGIHSANTTAADVKVTNSILANNTDNGGGNNCGGQALTDNGGNIQFNPTDTCGTMTVGDPQLQAATLGGGVNALVFVRKIGDTSAAQGHGIETGVCDSAPIYDLDEALNSRPDGKPNCDSGAFESGSTTPVRLQSFEVD